MADPALAHDGEWGPFHHPVRRPGAEGLRHGDWRKRRGGDGRWLPFSHFADRTHQQRQPAALTDHAEANARGDLTSPWHSLSGQIRLTAGGVGPVCDDEQIAPRPFGVQDHLDAALTVLDSIPSGLGPPDIGVWAWRVADLRSLVTAWAGQA